MRPFREIFSETLHELMCEVFLRHGITTMPDDEYDALIVEITQKHYFRILGECRRETGQSVVSATSPIEATTMGLWRLR